MRNRRELSPNIPLESFGLKPLTGGRMDGGIGLGLALGAFEWAMPSTYRSVEASVDPRIRRFAYFGQALMVDALAVGATVLLTHFLTIPDLTHNPALHIAQNIVTLYGEKGLINNAALALDWKIRRSRVRNDLRQDL